MTQVDDASIPVEAGVRELQALLGSKDFPGALRVAQELRQRVPDNRDVLFLLAMTQRFLGRIDEAMATLDHLERRYPRFSRLFQERGHCYVARRDALRAIDAFLRAVNINPALPSSWTLLEGLYRMNGEAANAQTAASHSATLAALPPEVVHATSLYSDGDLGPAEQIVRDYLLRRGNDPDAMRLLAQIGIAREAFDDAEILLEGVLRIAPDFHVARHDYARALLGRHKFSAAREQLQVLARKGLLTPDGKALLASSYAGLGKHDEAVRLYRELIAGATPDADVAALHLSTAHALKTLGRTPEAIDAYRAAAAARPKFGDAYWSLANLKTYRFLDHEIARMRAEEADPSTPATDRYHLCFALGKALEDRADYEESWTYYERGNTLKRSESRYRPEILENNTRLQKTICTRAFFEERAGWGTPEADPIFILGLPRSGSTLIEQILASHSQVEGTQELPDIQRFAAELQGREPDLDNPRYPGALAQLSADDCRKLGERFLKETRVLRSLGRAFFIDKMPNNFRHIGLIHLIVPNARIIDARREPMACCFSNLKQLFANGQEFSYGIDDIARYYRTYLELMEHWDVALPGRVLRVHHEDVVDDLERQVRRILDFCHLEFEPGCVEFHRTARSVRTASSEQVRQPIFREGLDQWKHFEPWLGNLRDRLGDALERYRN